jgi:hypothetical protein
MYRRIDGHFDASEHGIRRQSEQRSLVVQVSPERRERAMHENACSMGVSPSLNPGHVSARRR